MLDSRRKGLILGLSGAPMANSAGIGELVTGRTFIVGAAGNFVPFGAHRRVRGMLHRMRLEPFLTFSDDPELGCLPDYALLSTCVNVKVRVHWAPKSHVPTRRARTLKL